MLDSLSVLLAALVFIVFGYFSIVRLLYKLPFANNGQLGFKDLFRNYEYTIQLLGYSTLLVALPASSLLLFWGWGPALLWLVIFHLFFETVINLRDATQSQQLTLQMSLSSIETDSPIQIKVLTFLWQVLMILLCAVLLTQLAQMIDQHSGLLWALIFLIPASAILNTQQKAVPKTAVQLGAATVFCFGLIMADNLGISVYGSWAPFGFKFDWLVLNNASMTALGLVVTAKLLSKNDRFTQSTASLSGYLILSCLGLLIFAIIMIRPELDAPLQVAAQGNTTLPSLLSVSFILFGSALALTLRLLIQPQSETKVQAQGHFAARQSLALVQLIFCIVLVLALAAAMGIGAWNTHYADWSWSSDFLRHFELSQSTLFDLAANQSNVGSMIHTIFMAGVSLVILSLLLFCMRNLTLAAAPKSEVKHFLEFIIHSQLIHGISIFLLCCYFLSHGVSLPTWSLIGILAWFLLSHYVLHMASLPLKYEKLQDKQQENKPARLFQRIYSALSLCLILIGWLQLVLLALNWFNAQLPAFAVAAIVVLFVSAALWLPRIKQLVPHFSSIKNPALFK